MTCFCPIKWSIKYFYTEILTALMKVMINMSTGEITNIFTLRKIHHRAFFYSHKTL